MFFFQFKLVPVECSLEIVSGQDLVKKPETTKAIEHVEQKIFIVLCYIFTVSKRQYLLLQVLRLLLGELISFKLMVSNKSGNETINFNLVNARVH